MTIPPLRSSKPRQPKERARLNGRLGQGLLLIGTGRAAGFAEFGGSIEAFGASLAPLLGFLIVLTGVLALSGHALVGLEDGLTGLCAVLAPAVIAEPFCRRWQREPHWARYANVLNCAQWLMFAVLILLLMVASAGVTLGLPAPQAGLLVVAALGVYIVWFHWFAARHVLDLSPARALLVMVAVVFGTGLLLQAPLLLAGHPVSGPTTPN